MSNVADDVRLNPGRLRWHCRRGLLELDIALQRFLDKHFDALTPTQLDDFANLLSAEDIEFWAWVSGKEDCPFAEFEYLLRLIRDNTPVGAADR